VKKELPAHIVITKEVMQRCTHLLSDPSLRIRLKVPCVRVYVCVRVCVRVRACVRARVRACAH
jgi:hypothetical protein